MIVGMYLRTTKRKNKDGSVVTYYHLAHNVRHPETKQSTPRIIHNFGRADELDRQQLVRLCRSIARVCELKVTDPLQTVKSPQRNGRKLVSADGGGVGSDS